jgi:hypothetical protein
VTTIIRSSLGIRKSYDFRRHQLRPFPIISCHESQSHSLFQQPKMHEPGASVSIPDRSMPVAADGLGPEVITSVNGPSTNRPWMICSVPIRVHSEAADSLNVSCVSFMPWNFNLYSVSWQFSQVPIFPSPGDGLIGQCHLCHPLICPVSLYSSPVIPIEQLSNRIAADSSSVRDVFDIKACSFVLVPTYRMIDSLT